MITMLDALKLSRTKLKTRRLRLTITLVVMSLMFAALSFIAFFIQGGVHSLRDFSKEGYGSSVYISAYPQVYIDFDNPELAAAVKPVHDKLIADKKALAKKLNLQYDEKTDYSLPLLQTESLGGGGKELTANLQSPVTRAALADQNKTITGAKYTDFAEKAKKAGATKTYQSTMQYMYVPDSGGVVVLKNGVESYTANKPQAAGQPTGIDTIAQQGVTQMDDALLEPFVLAGQSLKVGQDGSIPLIAPFSAAQEIIGLKKLPATADADTRLERLIKVRKEAVGSTAQLCYRNSASQTLLQQAIQQRDEIESNKNNKEYEKPKLLYALPTAACGPTTISSDKRSSDEKKQDQNQKTFDTTFGISGEPVQGIVTVRIVGLSSDPPETSSVGIAGIFQSMLSSYTGVTWAVPASSVIENTLPAQAFGGTLASKTVGQAAYYAQFDNLAAAKQFINKNDCFGGEGMSISNEMYAAPNKLTKMCIASGKPFSTTPYGNNAGAIEELQSGIWKFGRYILLAILIIASVVMMGTLGKIIADSRRETAVFRALGAKRFDISQIYIVYALLISMLITLASLTVGAIGAWYVNYLYSPTLSVNAVLAYNASNPGKQFSVFGINPLYISVIIGLIIASALISTIIPLLTNMRRNPIRDMRDES